MIKINAKTKRITFQMAFPNAESAFVVGDFNNWSKSDSMKKMKNGDWKADIKLEPGEYQFKYFVNDAEWLNDAHAPRVPNNLGSENSVVVVETASEQKPAPVKKTAAKKAVKKPAARKKVTRKTTPKTNVENSSQKRATKKK